MQNDELSEDAHDRSVATTSELQALIEAQAAKIDALVERVQQLEGSDPEAPASTTTTAEAVAVGAPTSRRSLMTKGVAAAAGAVIGAGALAVSTASPAAAASGAFDGDPAVTGTANPTSGVGVRGVSASGTGVWGEGVVGVTGRSTLSGGVVGEGLLFGVLAQGIGSGLGLVALSSSAQLSLGGDPPPPTGTAGSVGSVVFDANHDLWLCVANGNPMTWRRISGPSTAGALIPLPAPVRAYDSRAGFSPSTGPKTPLTSSTPRTIDLTLNGTGVPVSATAALVNVVAVNPAAAGYMTIYRDGIATPMASNLNFNAGTNTAVTTMTALTNGKCTVDAQVAQAATDVVIDVLGYYQ